MTKTESAEKLIKTLVIESCEQLLDFHGAEGVRAAIPNTNNLIMVGPPDWIAKNVPGVEAMVEGEQPAIGKLLDEFSALPVLWGLNEPGALMRHSDVFKMLVNAGKTYLAATTQASTAQAERAPEGWKLVPIKPTDEMARAGYYALPEPAQDVNAEICWDAMLAAAPVTTTSSTDAQAAAEVRDALHLAEDALTSCLRGGYTDVDGDYVRTFSFDADKVDAALRALRAGDTGSGNDR